MSIFGSVPAFSDGQVLSASAHLNALQNYASGLRDEFLGQQMPFAGLYWNNSRPWSYTWSGYVRHRYDTLAYKIQLLRDKTVIIRVNGTAMVTESTTGTYSDTVDLSGLGLTVGDFYEVEVDTDGGRAWAIVWHLAETETLSLPALATFADATTPTAAQWNALSQYAGNLEDALIQPVPVGPRYAIKTDRQQFPVVYPFAMTINHRCRYLRYRIRLKRPCQRSNYPGSGGIRRADLRVYVDGGLALKLRIGDSGTADGSEYFQQADELEHTFEGTLDLDTYPGGLTQGSDYELYATWTQDTSSWDACNYASVLRLHETPASDEALTGWDDFTAWAHGDTAGGSTGDPRVQWIKSNLELLGAAVVVRNYPAQQWLDGQRLYGVRRRRWLHYRTEEGATPALTYSLRGENTDVSLPPADTQWLALDLDTVESLYPGVEYTLKDVVCALEDATV